MQLVRIGARHAQKFAVESGIIQEYGLAPKSKKKEIDRSIF
jgi:hypothetical protein